MAFDSYIRVSQKRGRGGDSYITVDEQRRLIGDAAARLGLKLGLEVVDEDVSGSKKAAERGLGRLLDRVEDGQSEGIIVAWQDRLSRGSMIETADVWERLATAKARLISAGDGVDSAAPGQELLFHIRAAIARDQWQRYRANWQTATRNAAERGIHLSGNVPLGYDRIAGHLVPNDLAPLVLDAFERRARGEPFKAIVARLAEQGVIVSYTGLKWVLSNPVYTGQSRGAGKTFDGAHLTIVSRMLFDQAQAAKPTRVRTAVTGAVTGKLLAQGIVFCETCGHRMNGSLYGGKPGKKASKLRYQCVYEHCTARAAIPANLLDPHLDEWFREHYARLTTVRIEPTDRTRVQTLENSYESALYDRDQFLANTKALTLLGQTKWEATLEGYVAAVDEARAAAEGARAEMPAPDLRMPLEEAWESWGIPDRRAFLLRFVKRVVAKPVYGKHHVPVLDRIRIETTPGFKKIYGLRVAA